MPPAFPFSFASLAVGILAVGVLYALHYLRIQPERQRVATLMFWKQAIRQQRTKVLFTKRFTHPATFALVALILLALAAALTADRWGRTGDDRRTDVMVIDTGSSMAAASGGRTLLASAAELARTDLKQLPSTPALITAGSSPLLLARSDEPVAVVRDRLASLPADNSASGSSQALMLARTLQNARAGDIYWYTTQSELPAGLPAEVAGRVKIRRVQPVEAVAITGATFTANPQDASRGSLTVRLTGKANTALNLTAQPAGGTAISSPVTFTGNMAEVTVPDLAADGQTIALSVSGAPGSPAEHSVTFALPRRTTMKVNFVGNIPATLRFALRAAGAEEATEGAIAVVEGDTAVPAGSVAAIRVITAGNVLSTSLPLTFGDSPLVTDIALEGAAATGGPALPDTGIVLLKAGEIPVATLGEVAGLRTLSLSSALLADTADLPKRAAFPVLLGRLAADLAGWSDAQPVVTSLRAVEDPLWRSQTPTAITTVHSAPPEVTVASTDVTDIAPTVSAGFTAGLRWVEVLLGGALTLLVVEGLLLAARKIV